MIHASGNRNRSGTINRALLPHMSTFRNIAAAFRRQDWATVLVEFVLVIVGVLIALRLDQFAEDRRVDLQELNFLKLILSQSYGQQYSKS